jgi:peroxin-6
VRFSWLRLFRSAASTSSKTRISRLKAPFELGSIAPRAVARVSFSYDTSRLSRAKVKRSRPARVRSASFLRSPPSLPISEGGWADLVTAFSFVGTEPHIAKVLQECIESLSSTWESSGYPVIVIGTTSDPEKVPLGILACFKHDIAIEVRSLPLLFSLLRAVNLTQTVCSWSLNLVATFDQAPDERERLQIIRSILSQTSIAADVDLESIAVQTAALVAQDLVSLVQRASSAAVSRISGPSSSLPLSQLSLSGLSLTAADFATAIDAARSAYSESIGAPKIPNVSWDDVGGLASVKGEILDTIELPLKRPELFGEGLKKRSGLSLPLDVSNR